MESFYRTEGNRENRAIVFVHGGGSSGLMWEAQVSFFKDKFYCIIPDLKGNGSRANETYVSIEDCAKEIIEVIKKEKPEEKVHLVGTSFGAAVATEVLVQAPELIDHACINSCNLDSHPVMKFISLLSIKSLLKTPWDRFKNMYKRYDIPENFLKQYHSDMQIMSLKNWQSLLTSSFDYRLKSNIINVKNKVLVFLGTKETSMAKSSMKKLAHSLPNGRGVFVKDETHAFCYQNPALFNELIDAWITDKELQGDLIEF